MLFQFMCEKKFLSFTLFRGGGTVHCTVQYLPVLYSTMLGACISYSVSKFDCPKSFHKTLKIEFRGSIFDLNSIQVWAIKCKSAIMKINSPFHQNLDTNIECSNWRELQTKHLLSITILKIGPCLLRFLLILYSWAVSRASNCGQFKFFWTC